MMWNWLVLGLGLGLDQNFDHQLVLVSLFTDRWFGIV